MTNSSYETVKFNPELGLFDINNASASARVSLFGGQVISYIPNKDKRERLYLSAKASMDGSKAIRGGVPVCWPWFGAHKTDSNMPAHGYVRKQNWVLCSVTETQQSTTLVIEVPNSTGPGFNGEAQLQLHITVGEQLEINLLTHNIGTESFDFSCALHTYFAVPDITQTTLLGLKGEYSDKTQDWKHFSTPEFYAISEETDRIHLEPVSDVTIKTLSELTTVSSTGHDSIVVWNPWTACAQNFPDMETTDYMRMICVETALTQGYVLEVGAKHVLSQTIG